MLVRFPSIPQDSTSFINLIRFEVYDYNFLANAPLVLVDFMIFLKDNKNKSPTSIILLMAGLRFNFLRHFLDVSPFIHPSYLAAKKGLFARGRAANF